MEYDYLFKLLLIGDSGIGKSSLLNRFADDTFAENYISTIGVDFKIKTVIINDKVIKYQLWDTSGQERFRTITSSYYRGAQGILVVYSVCDRESFKNVQLWIQEIRRYSCENISTILVGNKCDSPKRQVTYEEGQKLAENLGLQFYETSAKDNINVDLVFTELGKDILQRNLKNRLDDTNKTVKLGKSKDKNKNKKCC